MSLAKLLSIATPLTQLFVTGFALCVTTGVADADQKAAVFDFELRQGDVVPGAPDHHEAEERRLKMVGERLRAHLAKSGYDVVDIASVSAKATATNLESCSACADGFAQELGADYAVTGVVYKVSELILSMNVRVHDAATSTPLTSAIVDMRGNTDESWRRAVDYLYRNLLSPRLEKLKK